MSSEISFCPLCAGKLDSGNDERFVCDDCETQFLSSRLWTKTMMTDDDEEEEETEEEDDEEEEEDEERRVTEILQKCPGNDGSSVSISALKAAIGIPGLCDGPDIPPLVNDEFMSRKLA